MKRAFQQAIVRTGAVRTGDLLCPGIDTDEFKKQCQAPIFPNRWNHWRLYRTTRDNPSDQDVIDTGLAFLMQITKASDMGVIRHEEIIVVPGNSNASHSNPWQTPIVDNRMRCVQPIHLANSDFTPAYRTVYARFVYRGSRQSIPWPVRKVNALGLASWCPQNADWILDTVFAPSDVAVPSEKDDPALPGAIDQGLPSAPKLDLGTKFLLSGIGIVVVAGVLGYAVRSVR